MLIVLGKIQTYAAPAVLDVEDGLRHHYKTSMNSRGVVVIVSKARSFVVTDFI